MSLRYKAVTITGLVLAALTVLCRHCRAMADFYALKIYPAISCCLSYVSSAVPFSVQDIVVLLLVALAVTLVVLAVVRKWGWKKCVRLEFALALWVYVWFYAGWCLNYSRSNIFTRTGSVPQEFDTSEFILFLDNFVEEINAARTADVDVDRDSIEAEMKTFYANLPGCYGLSTPRGWQHPKYMMFSGFYTKVGVTGYMAPLFSEYHLNGNMPPVEFPFVLAHEYSHLMGVSSEAEANWWAFQCCRNSDHVAVRYSGCLGMLGYLWNNAASVLDKDVFEQWRKSLSPEVLADFAGVSEYWRSRISPVVSGVQNFVYDLFLKGNGIPSGTGNYSESVLLLMSLDDIGR